MRDSGLKNYTLIKINYANAESRELIGDDGTAFWPFRLYMDYRSYARSTRIAYATDVAYFLDYLAEVSNLLADGKLQQDPLLLPQLFNTWPSFSVLNKKQRQDSSDSLINLIGKRLNHPQVSEATISRRLAALKGFVELSDRFQQILNDRISCGMLDSSWQISDDKLFPQLNTLRNLSNFERARMIRNSMFAGVINRGPKLTSKNVLPRRRAGSGNASVANIFESNPLEKAFPHERIVDLIDAANSFRDKAYLSLLAAAGVRGSEARQILWEDIDPLGRTVRIVPPWNRRFTHKWDVLPVSVQEDIPWKGRATELTFLLEPFKSMFFDNLEKYRNSQKEWNRTIEHPFVFVKERRFNHVPILLSTPSTISEIFSKPRNRLKRLPHYHYGGHSLRHSYGLYIANSIPLDDGTKGMPIHHVQSLMGHTLISTTQVYAPADRRKIMRLLSQANRTILGNLVNMEMLASGLESYKVTVNEQEFNKLQNSTQDDLNAD